MSRSAPQPERADQVYGWPLWWWLLLAAILHGALGLCLYFLSFMDGVPGSTGRGWWTVAPDAGDTRGLANELADAIRAGGWSEIANELRFWYVGTAAKVY